MPRQRLKAAMLTAGLTLVAAAGFAQSAGGSGQPGQSSGSAQAGHVSGTDKRFVEKMYQANLDEVQLGQLGTQHATNPQVKAFAQMMVTDHSKSNEELTPIAQRLGVQLGTELDGKHRKTADKLSGLQGAEFDREFMKAMVDGHEQVIRDAAPILGSTNGHSSRSGNDSAGTGAGSATAGGATAGGATAASGSGSAAGSATAAASQGRADGDPAVADFAQKTLPVVQQHLQQARELERSLGK
jgi:putative membrane protein